MPVAHVELMVQDPAIGALGGERLYEGFDIDGEDVFLDGPVSRRVAVLDFDPETGDLLPGARFRRSRSNPESGRYQPRDADVDSSTFQQVNAFATVLQTMYLFEEPAALGRRLTWGFDGPQLLVVPRAGQWANAVYDRESRSVQFFFFDESGQRVYTSLSRDIVAHETGHAILDGIAPDLYHATSPQSLALHEAIADLVAVLMAFRSRTLRDAVLEATGGSIKESTAFNSIAEQFGSAIDRTKRTGYLRNLKNDVTMADVGRDEPHELSPVLTGALYSVMVDIHDNQRAAYEAAGMEPLAAAKKALRLGGELWKRLVLRALDYLPPGEVSFADYGRAIIASDRAAYPEREAERAGLVQQFVSRGMAPDAAALDVETNAVAPALRDLDLQTVLDSDWAAYQFADHNRRLLGIPRRVPFRVLTRRHVSKFLYRGGGQKERCDELLFKVTWDHTEPNQAGGRLPAHRQVTVGTTLAVDWNTRKVRSCLTSELSDRQRDDRDHLIRRLLDEEALALDELATGPDGAPLRSVVRARSLGGVMRMRATARTLHIVGR